MLLDAIEGPDDLRELDPGQLRALAAEIREVLIRAVSVNGGHLGSNLGAVELTLALHRVFDSPRDAIVWDTGHQAYVHKLVTGRAEGFERLRQAGGLSGYPSRAESEHDLVENSHASTAISYAFGLAVARDATDAESTVVAVVGDGALTGGLAYEALNNLGHSRRRAVVVLNDNGRCYAPTISRLTLAAVGAPHAPADPAGFFGALGLAYRGPIDGHDIHALETELRAAAAHDGPVVVHVVTRKGEGYLPAENDHEKHLHDVGAFDPETGRARPGIGSSYTAAFSAALIELATRHPEIHALTAGMPGSTGLLPFAERFPDRCFDVGIAEQHAVTAAAGNGDAAACAPSWRSTPRSSAARGTSCSTTSDSTAYPVVFCIDRAGITGEDGPSHHGLYDLALLTKVPGMTVFAPSSYEEVAVMLEEALRTTSGPVALRWPKTTARHVPPEQVGSGRAARKVRAGNDVCILAVGKMVEAAEEAAALLEGRGVHATVWDVRTVPLDVRMLDDARRHPLVVTAEDGIVEGGVGSLAVSALARLDGDSAPPLIVTLGAPVAFVPQGKPAELLANLGLDGPGIAAATLKALEARAPPAQHAPTPWVRVHRRLRAPTPRHRPGERPAEWLDSLDSVIDVGGRARARYLLARLMERAREQGVGVPAMVTTDYINTIPPEQEPWFPGDEVARAPHPRVHPLERDGDGRPGEPPLRRARRAPLDVRVGRRALRRRVQPLLPRQGRRRFGDQVFFQGHAAPGIYARAFLEGRLTEEQLDRFRREVDGGGLPSYPHPRRMPEFWEFPTVSMGLGPLNAVYQARFNRYLLHHEIADTSTSKVWCVRRRRRDGRARGDGRAVARGARAARQPDLRRQLQPAAPRRPGARQRQDHPGARGDVPRRRLERDQGDLGPRVGRAARPRRRRRARQQDEQHRRRRVPEVRGRERRLHPGALLRARPAAAPHGRAPHRRRPAHAARAAGTTTASSTPPTRWRSSTRAARR